MTFLFEILPTVLQKPGPDLWFAQMCIENGWKKIVRTTITDGVWFSLREADLWKGSSRRIKQSNEK